MVKNQPCNAGDVGSVSNQGTKISHAMGATHTAMKTQHSQNEINKVSKEGNKNLYIFLLQIFVEHQRSVRHCT